MDPVPLGVNETVCINTPPVTISTGSADCIREAASAGKLEASIKQGQVRGAANARPLSPIGHSPLTQRVRFRECKETTTQADLAIGAFEVSTDFSQPPMLVTAGFCSGQA